LSDPNTSNNVSDTEDLAGIRYLLADAVFRVMSSAHALFTGIFMICVGRGLIVVPNVPNSTVIIAALIEFIWFEIIVGLVILFLHWLSGWIIRRHEKSNQETKE